MEAKFGIRLQERPAIRTVSTLGEAVRQACDAIRDNPADPTCPGCQGSY